MNDHLFCNLSRALISLPEGTSHGDAPALDDVYLPRSHAKAMNPDSLLVTGMRGAGKTFWWSAFQNPNVRHLLARRAGRSTLSEKTVVLKGFGVTPAIDEYPSKDVLRDLLRRKLGARDIWRSVQAWQLADNNHPLRSEESWTNRVHYVRNKPEQIDRLFENCDKKFNEKEIYCIILFDALDRCADDWKDMYKIIRGLLQTAIEMRSYRRIRLKIFLRSDQLNESEIGDFPDASKALSSAVELSWPRHELYGLLWHYLANDKDKNADSLRNFLDENDWTSTPIGNQNLYEVPRKLVVKEEKQREKFHQIAGPWMGRDRRRGFPYTWIPNHLADTEGRVSPRSFLAALRAAADDTENQRSDYKYPLHYESIKRGVQEASKIRVRELQEDYPWVHQVLNPLKGMVVPCDFGEISERWRKGGVLDLLAEDVDQDEVKLPPLHIDDGADGIREDLGSLGIFLRMHDDRVNIPDVFRVGYGLGRRGGVKTHSIGSDFSF